MLGTFQRSRLRARLGGDWSSVCCWLRSEEVTGSSHTERGAEDVAAQKVVPGRRGRARLVAPNQEALGDEDGC